MKKKIIFQILAIFGTSLCLLSQDNPLNNIHPPSPTAAHLGKFGNIPVNGYTGAATINIPLFTIKERDLEIPVTLTYSSNGVKPREEPGWVGTDWILNAGGVITRSVNHIRDELERGFINNTYNTPTDIMNGSTITFTSNPNDPNNPDMEPDVFYFNFLGYSGRFYKNNSTSGVQYEIVPHANFNIDIDINTAYEITRITIVDEKGVTYEFGYLHNQSNLNNLHNGGIEYVVNNRTPSDFTTTSWYLTKISSPSGAEIILNYDRGSINSHYEYQTYYFDEHQSSKIYTGGYLIPCKEMSIPGTALLNATHNFFCFFERIFGDKTYSEYLTRNLFSWQLYSQEIYSTHYPSYLSSISTTSEVVSFQTENHPSVFSVSNGLNNIRRLYEIVRTPMEGSEVISYNFDYWSDYTRLMLKSVQESATGEVTKPPYEFTYHHYNPNSVSLTMTTKVDHWGYYNGNVNNTNSLLPGITEVNRESKYPGREPDGNYCDYNLLSRVTYPTGGYSELHYEPHSYNHIGKYNSGVLKPYNTSLTIAGGARISQVTHSGLNGNKTINYDYHDGILYSKPEYLRISHYDYYGTYFELWEYKNSSFNFLGDKPVTYRKIRETYADNSYKETSYTSLFEENDLFLTMSDDASGIVSARLPNFRSASSNEQYRGKELNVTYYNANGSHKKEVAYNYQNISEREVHKFKIYIYPNILYPSYTNTESGVTLTYVKNICNIKKLVSSTTTEYLANGNITSTKTFEYEQDYWQNRHNKCQLTAQEITNSDNSVMRTEYTYPSSVTYGGPDEDTFKDECLGEYLDIWNIIYQNSAASVDYLTGEVDRNKAIITYNEYSFMFKITINNYIYRLEQLGTQVQNTGKRDEFREAWIIDDDVYIDDCALNKFTVSSADISLLEQLKSSNMNSLPLETVTKRNQSVIEGNVVLYTLNNNQVIVPYKYYNTKKSTPVTDFQGIYLDGNGLIGIHADYKLINTIDRTDSHGNIIEYTKDYGKPNSIIRDPMEGNPISVAVNAEHNEIYHTSFEYDKDFYSWNDPSYAHSDIRAYTGSSSLKSANEGSSEIYYFSPMVYPTNSEQQTYKFSGWVYSEDVNGPSADIYILYNTAITGTHSYCSGCHAFVRSSKHDTWEFLEGEITVPSSAKQIMMRVDNNGRGTVYFDDLRLYPADAQMKTYTYIPLKGVTSITDERNKKVRYHFDGYGRLEMITDHNDDILQTIKYNYQ